MRTVWSKILVIAAIRKLHRSGIRINSNYIQNNYRSLYRAAVIRFGSWGDAVEVSGYSYAKVLARKPPRILKWGKEVVISKIRELYEAGEKLNSNYTQTHHQALYGSAIRCFGGWGKAIKAAGYDYYAIRAVRPFRFWTKEKIVVALKSRHRKKRSMETLAIQAEDPGLNSAIKRHFGKSGMRKAFKAAGLNKRDFDPRIIWTKKKVLREIRRLKRFHIPLYNYYLANSGYQSLASGGTKVFGSWKKAIEAAGIDYESVRAVRRRFWNKRRIIAEIKRLIKKGERLSSKRCHFTHGDLFAAACNYFGGWGQAVEAAGISYREHCTIWSYKTWIRNLSSSGRQKIRRQAMRHAEERRNAS